MNYDLNKVKQAAKFLDEKHPGWFKKINMMKFELASTDSCILAQLYGASYMGTTALGIAGYCIQKEAFGYIYGAQPEPFKLEKLTRKWIKQINKRLEQEND